MVDLRLGLLGGGQLARMLALHAFPLGIRPHVFTTYADDPAAQVCGETMLGTIDDRAALERFLHDVDVVTFESEFVDVELLRKALPKRVRVFPSLDAIGTIQDRASQKRLLDQHKIPTSPWCEVAAETDLPKVHEKFPEGFVLKARRFGYDGYGTFKVSPQGKPDPAWLKRLDHGFIAEELQPFKRELALSIVRSESSEFRVLPLVESVQVESRCFSVRGPVAHSGLAALTRKFKALMTALDYVGILAVELFEVKGQLLVNELAPRVHNSAHYSQNALTCSQFEYHVRAGLDFGLPAVTSTAPAFAMVNLLGDGGEVELNYDFEGWLHWYGKTENRKGRKLGHLNVVDRTSAAALKRALRWRKDIEL